MTNFRYILIIAMAICLSACKSEYTSYVQREIASGVTNDSLAYGLFMGQTRKQFYDHCWELNRQKKVHQGSGANIKVDISADEFYPERGGINLLFYGAFDDAKIMRGMNFTYSYKGWAPWNEALQADSLIQHLEQRILRDYGGNDWIEVEFPKLDRKAHVKIDGNRQFLMYRKDNQLVKVKIRDLNHPLDKSDNQ